MAKPLILVADDEADILASIRFNLEAEGFDVITADDGAEALEKARQESPDLILMDVMMPMENGYRVARALRDDFETGMIQRRIPIILVTARNLGSDPEREKMFMDFSKADRMIYKPFSMDDLIAQIRALCEPGRTEERAA